MVDEILEEVWRIRDEYTRRHNYSLDAMVAALRETERQPLSRVISKEKKTPNKRLHPDADSRRR